MTTDSTQEHMHNSGEATSYAQRSAQAELDKILEDFYDGDIRQSDMGKAKQAITSLIKELVAEAKPHKRLPDDSPTADEDLVNYGYNQAIDEFEQNLLKALEEVE